MFILPSSWTAYLRNFSLALAFNDPHKNLRTYQATLGINIERISELAGNKLHIAAATMQLSLKDSKEIVSFLSTLTSERQSGEVLLQSSEQSAKVYLNDGLILWAFATGQQESFQSILIKENQLTKEALLEGIKTARENGKKNLDDILLALGVSGRDDRNTIIERHTRSALVAIKHWESCQARFNATEQASTPPSFALELHQLLGIEPLETSAQTSSSGTRDSALAPKYGSDVRPKSKVDSLESVLERFRIEVPGFVASMVIDGETGMPIATLSDIESLDLEVASAYFRNVSKSALDALHAMGKVDQNGSVLEEILVTSVDEFALVRVIKEGEHFLYVSMDKGANPAMARVVIRRYAEDIEKFLT